MTGTTLVSIVAIIGSLVLALRGMRSRALPARSWWMMAAAWVVIIVFVVVLINMADLDLTS